MLCRPTLPGATALATATGNGNSGSVTATSGSVGVHSKRATTDSLGGSNTVTANVGSQTRVDSFTATDGTMWSTASVNTSDAYSLLTFNPSSLDVQTKLAGQTNILGSLAGLIRCSTATERS